MQNAENQNQPQRSQKISPDWKRTDTPEQGLQEPHPDQEKP
jgi:hypothetical protein